MESVEDVQYRAKLFMSELLFELDYINVFYGEPDASPPQPINILIVSHEGFFQQLFRHVFHLSDAVMPQHTFRPGSLSQIDLRYTIEEQLVGRLNIYARRFSYVARSVVDDTKHQTDSKDLPTWKSGATARHYNRSTKGDRSAAPVI